MRLMMSVALPAGECDQGAELVLRDKGPGQHMRYVTHQHNTADGEDGGYYWGHYHADLGEALEDFAERGAVRGALWGTLWASVNSHPTASVNSHPTAVERDEDVDANEHGDMSPEDERLAGGLPGGG